MWVSSDPLPPTVRLPLGSHPIPLSLLKRLLNCTPSPYCIPYTSRPDRRRRVYTSRPRLECTHSQPSTPAIIYVPAPRDALGKRGGSFKPSPAPITESLTWDGLLQNSMSTFHLWQNTFHAGWVRSDYVNGSFGPNSLG